MPAEPAGAKLGEIGLSKSKENRKKIPEKIPEKIPPKIPPKIPQKVPTKNIPPSKTKSKPKPKPKKKPAINNNINQRKITELFKPKDTRLVNQHDAKTCEPCASNENDENKIEKEYSSEAKVRTTFTPEPDSAEIEFDKIPDFPKQVDPAQINK